MRSSGWDLRIANSEGLRSLADILRRSRGSRELASEARTIIVLAPKAKRRVS